MSVRNEETPSAIAPHNNVPKILLLAIDDDASSLELIREGLEHEEVEILTANTPQQGLDKCHKVHPQIVLCDLMMPDVSGMEVLEQIVSADPVAEVILMTGHYSTDSAVLAIQKGAADYLIKPLNLHRLRERIAALVAESHNRQKALQVDAEALRTFSFQGIIGRSPLMLEVFAKIRRIAPHFRTALITGPTGTGKELVAQALHKLSPVASKPFAVCNCAAIVDTLFESELFGYVKGAFTGATQDKVGLFEYANGGTVFLDEIGELPLNAQAKLLRVLQQHEVQRVGSSAVRKVDVRVIAATNRDLRQLVVEKKFREDLYYRLTMLEITLPGLAERKEDLPLLQRHFIDGFAREYGRPVAGLTRRAQAVLAHYSWPGNVRELENLLGNACMMTEGIAIDIKDLPEQIRKRKSNPSSESPWMISVEEMELRHLQEVLARVGGNRTQAGEVLRISRGKLYRLLAVLKTRSDLR
jgi:DNA-binding NtrC family response regulator